MKLSKVSERVERALQENLDHKDDEKNRYKYRAWKHKYRKTKGVYKNSRGTFALNLVNESGHSYGWWSLFERIAGKLVLNTYRYSSQTAIHISSSKHFLERLGIRFIEIEAPQGLQDLKCAKSHAAYKMGETIVKNHYSRKPCQYGIKHAQGLIDNLARIGIEVTKKDINKAIDLAEKYRLRSLERARTRRAERAKFNEAIQKPILTLVA